MLPSEDSDAAAIVARRLAADGVTLRLGVSVAGISTGSDGIQVRLNSGDGLKAVPYESNEGRGRGSVGPRVADVGSRVADVGSRGSRVGDGLQAVPATPDADLVLCTIC